jgi:hypothetical protein
MGEVKGPFELNTAYVKLSPFVWWKGLQFYLESSNHLLATEVSGSQVICNNT